jgi:hypothetical protein
MYSEPRIYNSATVSHSLHLPNQPLSLHRSVGDGPDGAVVVGSAHTKPNHLYVWHSVVVGPVGLGTAVGVEGGEVSGGGEVGSRQPHQPGVAQVVVGGGAVGVGSLQPPK